VYLLPLCVFVGGWGIFGYINPKKVITTSQVCISHPNIFKGQVRDGMLQYMSMPCTL